MSVNIDFGKYAVIFSPNTPANGTILIESIFHNSDGQLQQLRFDDTENVINYDDDEAVKNLVPQFFNQIIGPSRGGGKRTRRKIRKNNKRRKKSSTQKNT